jgi:hypothetical protein
MGSDSSTVVEPKLHHSEVKGSSTSSIGDNGKKKSSGYTVVEKLSHHPYIKGSVLPPHHWHW